MQNYEYYNELLAGRCKLRRKLANHTYAVRDSESRINIRLHGTNVVTYHSNGRITLSSGGWRTPTTKDRINEFSPFRLWQDKGIWSFTSNGTRSMFYDGITIMKNGRIIKPLREDKKTERLMKLIAAYCEKLKALDVLPKPEDGDCWLCSYHEEKTGKTFGEIRGSENQRDHILQHLKETYIHGSLIINAMRWAGYRDIGISLYYRMWSREAPSKTSVVSAVRRYMKRQCGIA